MCDKKNNDVSKLLSIYRARKNTECFAYDDSNNKDGDCCCCGDCCGDCCQHLLTVVVAEMYVSTAVSVIYAVVVNA